MLTTTETTSKQGAAAPPKPIRVVLIVNDQVLRVYGPVLRRLSVGLIDEVAEINLLCLGDSPLVEYVPSPPVRVITAVKERYETSSRTIKEDQNVSIIAPKYNILHRLRPSRRAEDIIATLKQYKPTLLHALSERHARLTQVISKKMQIPYVVSILTQTHGHLPFSPTRCGQILPCSSSLAREVRQHYKNLSNRIHLLPIGTHVNKSACCFDHGDKPAQLFCCAPLSHHYGIEHLINAAKQLSDSGHKFHLIISGEGSAEREYRKMVRTKGLAEQVHFVAPIKSMIPDNDAYKAVLKGVDIFIQPWPEMTWRPELLEAMSVGAAVVIADGTETDLVRDGKTALTVPFGNVEALTNTLDRLLNDRDYARSLANASQQYLRKHFLAHHMVTRLGQAYREAVKLEV